MESMLINGSASLPALARLTVTASPAVVPSTVSVSVSPAEPSFTKTLTSSMAVKSTVTMLLSSVLLVTAI